MAGGKMPAPERAKTGRWGMSDRIGAKSAAMQSYIIVSCLRWRINTGRCFVKPRSAKSFSLNSALRRYSIACHTQEDACQDFHFEPSAKVGLQTRLTNVSAGQTRVKGK
jgi:hypothetical protein